METKEEINRRISETYNRLTKEAKHGHYETLYHIVHAETEDLRTRLAAAEARLKESEGLLKELGCLLDDMRMVDKYHLGADDLEKRLRAFLSPTPAPDVEYVTVRREDLKEIIRITDRKGELWDRLKAALGDKP